ncbi:MAG: TonB-dependent receptor [Bacteroidetes bacterium]|nr:MAG: TonB-dependent receptor [Bacteroidota bacterium]
MLKRITQFITILLLAPFFLAAQETNSGIGGIVKDASNNALVGATITATHNPTGTVYRVVSRAGGRYDISNMQPGGPYTITFTFVGFSDEKRDEVFLNLGEKSRFDVALPDKTGTLTEVVLSTRRSATGGKGGTETAIGRDRVANIPTINRSLNDFLRFTPQAKITGDGAGISFAGQNNRLNSFFIDGAINNDVFGLAASGTNGGQANISPISLDAIDQFQVVLAPYDASVGGFVGGGSNAVTKSGTNTLKGTAWFYYRDETLAGRTPGNVLKANRTKLTDLSNKTYGISLGGALVKNKLFFFVIGERQQDTRPQPFEFSSYRGNTNQAGIDGLVSFVQGTHKYDVGPYLDIPESVRRNFVQMKLDWNMNSNNKFTFSYRFNQGERYNTTASNTTNINFYNNGYIFPNKAHTVTGELRSSFKKGATNRLLITYTNVADDRKPIGDPFPRVIIRDGSGTITFGTENFSTGNYLLQKNWTLNDSYKFYAGKHLISIGTDNLYSDANNLFIRDLYGTYTYNSLSDFTNNAKPARYQRSFSLLENKTDEKNSPSAAAFKFLNLAFFVNDEVKANDKMTINFGVRLDKTIFPTDPLEDPFFNDTALVAISQYYNMYGATSGKRVQVPWSVSPRFGFVYKVPEENFTLRGGIGLFTGRMGLVWPGGAYNNTGASIGGMDPTVAQINARPDPFFRNDPFNQYKPEDFGISLANSKGQVDIMSSKFKLPRIVRTTLAADKRLGNGWTLTGEIMFTKNINEINYQNVNILPPTLTSVGAGPRTVYSSAGTAGPSGTPLNIPMRSNGVNPYTGVYLIYNNPSTKKGFSYNTAVTIDKAFKNGWAFNFSWAYGNSIVYNELTSSQNNSQWLFMETVNGKNYVQRSISDFDQGHRFVGYVSKKFSYLNKKMATTITFTYNGQQGNAFSYVYNASIVGDAGRTSTNDLIYIPTQADLAQMTFTVNTVNGVAYSIAQQKELLEQYIVGNKYLRKRRGQFAERNGDRQPFAHVVDMSIRQDFNLKMGKKMYLIQFTYDVYNFTNMLSHNWGQTYFLSNDQYALIRFTGFTSATNLTPQYQFSPQTGKPWGVSTSNAAGISARFISQVGLRLSF